MLKVLPFNARVKIVSRRPLLKSIRGKEGTVLGRAMQKNTCISYAILVDKDDCWSVLPSDIKATGEIAPTPKVKHVRILVDKAFRGRVAKPEE